MLISFVIFFFLFELKQAVSLKQCPPPSFFRYGSATCLQGNETVSCELNLPSRSVVKFTCQEFYKLSSEKESFLECLPNGSWSSNPPKCIPDCGRRSASVSLIVNGVVASRGAFPWHVAIYNLINGIREYWCGGSLISETAVITAAHCTWQIHPEKLLLAFGKFHREFDFPEETVQRIKAKKIKILSSYQDVTGNYNGDVAIVFLERPVMLGHYSVPVCIDWDQRLMEKHLAEGTFGVVLGWGLTENDTFSDSLRVVRIPVVSDEKCIAEQERDFRKFITYTSFCAGFGNGTGVCNGDSGGGLTFFDEVSGRWYLQGLVSVSPRKKGTFYCDPNFYTVFTKVSMFSKWIEAMEKLEEKFFTVEKLFENLPAKEKRFQNFYDFVRKYGQKSREVGGRKLIYPHNEKMLELARYFKGPKSFEKNYFRNTQKVCSFRLNGSKVQET